MKVLVRLFVLLVFASSVALADDAIFAAQKKLQKLGFYSGTPDGQYGSQTAAAIRRYQVAENLKVTGDLTPQTLKSLGISAPAPKPATPAAKAAPAAPAAKAAPAPAPVPQYVAIADIFKGGPYITAPTEVLIATIRRAQKNLKLLGYYSGPIDGQATSTLTASLKAWQKSAGFRQTGRFDESTLKGLDLMGN